MKNAFLSYLRLFYKTAFRGQILCNSRILEFSLIIGNSNDTKRKEIKENDYRYIEILILVLKNRKYAQ